MNLFVKKKHGKGFRKISVEAEIMGKIYDKTLFAHKSLDPDYEWSVSELETGAACGHGRTINFAYEDAKTKIKGAGKETFLDMIAGILKEHGAANAKATT